LERERPPRGPVDRLQVERPQPGLLAGEEIYGAVEVDTDVHCALQAGAREAWRSTRLAAVRRPEVGDDRLRVELRDPGRLAAELAERLLVREVAEELQRDHGRDEAGQQDAREEEERQPDPEGPEHALSVAYQRIWHLMRSW